MSESYANHQYNPYSQHLPPSQLHPPTQYHPHHFSQPPSHITTQPIPQQPQEQTYRNDGTHQQQPQTAASEQQQHTAGQEIIANRTDDWTASLVRLSKSAELKKHALTLQLHTTRILSYDATLQKKEKSLVDFKKRRDLLESQRAQLLNQLREVNENREKVDLEESKAQKEHVLLCDDIRRKVQELTDGEYATAKREVDKLRQELGLDPSKTIESQLEEKARKRRNSTNGGVGEASQSTVNPEPIVVASPQKRGPGRPPKVVTAEVVDGPPPPKRPRGRPKGSKNKPKDADPNASERPVS